MRSSYDAIVVGSGFGGGIAACRLAEAGHSVCVLERGRRFGRDDFPGSPEQAPEALFHEKVNPGGLFDVRMMRDVTVITADELAPWYTRTEDALQPRTTPPDPPLRKVEAFAAAGRHAGREAELLPIAVHFGDAREHPFSGAPQEGCQNLARCDLGCPIHAKNTVDITYIARAEAHGAEVHPLHLVEGIVPPASPGGPWRIAYRTLPDGPKGTVEAPTVVLAAGTIGSSRLLLTNRKRLKALSPALGSRFSGNGDALGMAFEPKAPDVRDARNDFGPVMTSRLDYGAERRLMLADGGLPANFDVLLDVARGVDVIRGWQRWLLRLRDVLIKVGWSDQALRPREVSLAERQTNTDALVFLMIGRDAADGQMLLTPLRRFDIRWSKAGSAQLFADLERTAKELAAAADATPFYALEGGPLSNFATVHPLGGCPMADDPARGVVDDGGAVHGYPGLYVLDGSIVPTSLGVNPSKTIAALAERGVERLVERLS